MNALSRSAFEKRAQAVAESLYPGRIQIGGGSLLPCSLTFGTVEVELDRGLKTLRSATASVARRRLPTEPVPKAEPVTLNGESSPVWTLVVVSGHDSESWVLELVLFPEKR
jgi:hypothetical protein